MKRFSVLLRYPDYMNDDGTETFYHFVRAVNRDKAVIKAQRAAAKHNEIDVENADDFVELLVLSGHRHAI